MSQGAKWDIVFLSEVVVDEFLSLPKDMQAYFAWVCTLIEKYGLENVGKPHIGPLRDKLWEIRLKGRDGIARALYVTKSQRKIIILRVFKKKTREVPNKEMELALRRLKEG